MQEGVDLYRPRLETLFVGKGHPTHLSCDLLPLAKEKKRKKRTEWYGKSYWNSYKEET